MTPSDASTPPAPSAARAAGSALAGHRIEAVLHAGPVFTVYRAVDALGIERVALKEYCPRALCARDAEGAPCLREPGDPAAHAAFEAGRAAFVEEMRRLERLRLPGVVRVRDLVEAEGSLCALMPLLPGVTLDALPASQNDDALHALLLSLVEPLAQLHAAGLVHGALHARQLLWQPGRAPVLLGFGLAARALGVQPQPDDRAPELRSAGADAGPAVGPWTDLYALAAMVLRQLSGRSWDEAAAGIGVAALLEKALGPARDAGKRVVLVQALQSSLERTPAQRPRHAGELRAQLVAAGVSRSAQPAGAAQPPQPGRAGRASSPLPEAIARGAPRAQAPLPALRPDGSCVIPQPPRRRDDSRRNTVLIVVLAASCMASGWWVRGLWSQEQERQRIDRMLVSAATPPAWATAQDGGVDPAGLPSPSISRDPTDVPPAPALPVEPRPPQAAAEARVPAGPEVTAAGAGATLPNADAVPAPAAAPAVVAQAEPAAVPPAALPVPEAPATAQAVPVAAPAAPAVALQAPAAMATPVPAAAPAAPAVAAQAIAPAPVPAAAPAAAAKADKPIRIAVLSPVPAPKPAPSSRAAAQPSSRASVQPAERRAQQAPSKRVASRAEAPAARSARTPIKTVATTSPEAAAAASAPRAACGSAAKYALLQCLKRQCSQSSQRDHPQCQRLLRDNEITS